MVITSSIVVSQAIYKYHKMWYFYFMSNFEKGFPKPEGLDQPNILDSDTLFALLAASGITELATSDSVTTVYVDSTPKDKGELYVNPDGKPVHGFMTKFSEGFTGWKQGDLVRARFVVSPKSDQVTLLVADSYVGDIRHADEFVLEGDQEELAKLRGLGMTELDVDVEVTSEEREYIVSNMFKYSARVDRVNNVLTAWDGESELTPGQVLLQGKVQEYVANTSNDYKDRHPTYMTIDVNGKPVVINMNGGYVAYEGSQYEKLLSETPETGDVVQVLASYNPDFEQRPYGRERVSAFDASWCRSTYCLVPNPDRAASQEAFHASLENMIGELAEITDPAAFRQLYGKIIDQAVVNPKTFVKDCRTAVQQKRMAELVDAVFDEDSHMAKPLLAVVKDFPSIYSTFNEQFKVNLYSMSVSEAYAFVMEVAKNPSKLDPEIVNTDYLYRAVDDALTPEQMSVLANTVIDNYYPVAVRQGKSFKKEDYVPEPGKVPYNNYSITESAIVQLSQTGLESDIETLTALFENSIANDQFAHLRGEDDFMPKIADSLDHALCKAGIWTVDKGWHEVTDRERLQLFTQTILPRLTAAMGVYTTKVDALPVVDDEKYAAFSHSFTLDRLQRMVGIASELEALAA